MIHCKSLVGLAGLVFALLCSPAISFACAWVHGTTLEGLPASSSSFSTHQVFLAMKTNPVDRLPGISNSPTKIAREARENSAVALMFSGTPQEAARLLLELEKESPGDYTIAANLGTAYELAGDAPNAQKWIKIGVQRNPDSHSGTEWVHELILKTKLQLHSDPEYLAAHRIIPLPERFENGTLVEIEGKKYSVWDIARSLNYQLKERCVFVKPPDPIVADLLFTYARIQAHTGVVEEGLKLLAASKDYGFADPALLAKTEARYKASVRIGWIYKILASIVVIVGASAFIYVAYRKKWLVLSRAEIIARRDARRQRKFASPDEW